MKQIVIAGAGFGGVSTALALNKNLRNSRDVQITLVDRKPYHTAHSYLYEVASSPEELTSLSELKQSVAIPLEDIFAGTRVRIEYGTITKVSALQQRLELDRGALSYDYLALALGSSPNFYGIPGAEQFSLPMKTVRDALMIRNRLQFVIEAHRWDTGKKLIRIVVAGGGFAGVETAAELKGLLDFLAWKEQYPRQQLEIMVVEGAHQLMPGMASRMATDVHNRLKDLGIIIRTNSLVTKVDEHFLEFNNGEKLEYDTLIWTAGVKANQVLFSEPIDLDRGNRAVTNERLQLAGHPNIFVIGDASCFLDKQGKPLPGTARQAIDQGKYVGAALAALVENRQPRPYSCKQFGYIVPLGGKWAIMAGRRLYMKGFWPYVFRQLGWLRYFWSVLGLRRAYELSILENRLYGRND
jgi:NADH dehydrogenase